MFTRITGLVVQTMSAKDILPPLSLSTETLGLDVCVVEGYVPMINLRKGFEKLVNVLSSSPFFYFSCFAGNKKKMAAVPTVARYSRTQ